MILKPHQIDGAQYLAGSAKRLLADPPGMMKTLTSVHSMHLRGSKYPLVICPAIVRSHWLKTFEEYGADGITPTVKSYDEIVRGGAWLQDELLDYIDGVHCDEFHFMKHSQAKRTQIILGKGGYVRQVGWASGSSGTPLDKYPTNAWTILSTFRPDVAVAYGVPSYTKYVEKFAPHETRTRHGRPYTHWFPEARNPELFAEMLSHAWLRREGLPGIDVLWSVVRLDAPTAVDYTTLSPTLFEALKTATDVEALAEISKDPEVSRAMRRLGEHKAHAVVALVSGELEGNDEKVVLFAHHRSVLTRLKEGLHELGVAYIDGDTSQNQREEEIRRFANDPDTRVFIGQSQACGTGMDGLQYSGARRVLIVEQEWSAILLDQLSKRVARHGNVHETVSAQLVALSGTLDEAVMKLNEREVNFLAGAGL